MINWPWIGCVAIACLVVSGCDVGRSPAGVETLAGSNAVRDYDPQQLALGQRVFAQHCAICHGANGEGAPNWRQRDADGFFRRRRSTAAVMNGTIPRRCCAP